MAGMLDVAYAVKFVQPIQRVAVSHDYVDLSSNDCGRLLDYVAAVSDDLLPGLMFATGMRSCCQVSSKMGTKRASLA